MGGMAAGGTRPIGGSAGAAGEPSVGGGGTDAGGAGAGGGGELSAGAGAGGSPDPLTPPSSFSCDDLPPLDLGAGGVSGEAGAGGAESDAGAAGAAGAGGAIGAGGAGAGPSIERTCVDFNDPTSVSGWQPDGGEWTFVNEGYVGAGPPLESVTCGETGSLMTASLLPDVVATDLRVRAQLTSVQRVDKVIVLRARDSSNRVELNFRASFDDNGTPQGGDLVVQELVDCLRVERIAPGELPAAHEVGESIDVDISLRGQQLTVLVNGAPVLGGVQGVLPTLTSGPGGVGVGVIADGITRFDDLIVDVLD